MNLPGKILSAPRQAARWCESRWFDWTRHVQTHGHVTLQEAGIAPEQAAEVARYVPARAANIRAALRSVPAANLSRYTFVDLGCGKGRGLFIAAEFAFHRIVGVELSAHLYGMACRNVASFRYRGHRESRITALAQDATTFEFPAGPLVMYMFHPFGPGTMQAVLKNLEQSLQARPRHVVIILVWPVLGHLVLRVPSMQLVQKARSYTMYEAHAAEPPAAARLRQYQ